MDASVVLRGDKTTHGGPVMSASLAMFIHSETVALMRGNVDCPKPGQGNNLNVECCSEQSEDGRAKGSIVALASPADGSFRALSVVAWVMSWDGTEIEHSITCIDILAEPYRPRLKMRAGRWGWNALRH